MKTPEHDIAFIEEMFRKSLEGVRPERDEIIRLLSFEPDSAQARFLGEKAREMARIVADNKARVWAAIGVDSCICPMNCAFCALGERWGVVKGPHEWDVADVVEAARRFAEEGASWLVLRTTEYYGQDRLRALAFKVRDAVPANRALVANTGQLGPLENAALRAAGISVVYHALRLGEGRDTPFDPAERKKALARVKGTGLALAHLVEPVGVEHTNEEIADVLLAALEAGAEVCGAMKRVNVPGTPFEHSPDLPEERLAQIVAVTRLCGGRQTPHICVHPPTPQAVAWGANVLVVETGAVPRDDVEISGEWHRFRVSDAEALFTEHGYAVEHGV